MNASWHCSRAEEFDAAASSFDLITIGEAFHRLDQGAVRRAALRWLKPGGILVMSWATPNLRKYRQNKWHLREWYASEVGEMLKGAGLDQLSQFYLKVHSRDFYIRRSELVPASAQGTFLSAESGAVGSCAVVVARKVGV